MPCEILESCRFFRESMKDLPKSTEYMRGKICHGNYQSCSRYQIWKSFGAPKVPHDLVPRILRDIDEEENRFNGNW